MIRFAVVAVLLALSGCNGIKGLNPGPDVEKQRGPLTVPPPAVLRGTAK